MNKMVLLEYKEIDKLGYVVNTHIIEELTGIPLNYRKSWGIDDSFYVPRWDNGLNMWIEARNPQEGLQEARDVKIKYLRGECQKSILGRFKAKLRKKEYTFSYDKEAQMNLTERWQLFQNNMVESLVLTAKDEVTQETSRLKVNKLEFTAIYLASVKHKEDNISRLQDLLIPLVNKAVSIKQIEDIHWTNEMIYPNEPSIIVKDDKTLDKNIGNVEMKAEMISQANQLNGLAMMEIANFVFANGFNKVP